MINPIELERVPLESLNTHTLWLVATSVDRPLSLASGTSAPIYLRQCYISAIKQKLFELFTALTLDSKQICWKPGVKAFVRWNPHTTEICEGPRSKGSGDGFR